MNILQRAVGKMFGYDATESRGRRKAPITYTMSEDRQANDRKRTILSANTRDLARNFAIAAWAIRKHLDYVTRFTFQSKTGDRGFDREFEQIIKEQSTRHRFEVARRHTYRRALRIAEACRVKDGDVFWLKLAPPNSPTRGKVQAIEGDRIRMPRQSEMPRNTNLDEWVNGVRVSKTGGALAYAVCDRSKNTNRVELKRIVNARNVFAHGFYDRYDQVRGVSPIAAGLNWFRDTYEGFEYALAKVKVSQLFGLAFYRDADASPFGTPTATTDTDDDGTDDAGYEVDLNKGPFTLDLDPGDRAEFLENKTPAEETVDFLKMMIHVALKSLDIPYSFFDESFTNFYGSRGGLIQYLKSTENKIEDLQEFQNEWLQWRAGLLVEDKILELPQGKDFSFLKWEFVPDGVPWWDPVKEVRGNAMAVAAGFSSPQRVCREVGTDFEENIQQTAEAMRIAEDLGVPLTFADSTAFRPAIESNGDQVDEQ